MSKDEPIDRVSATGLHIETSTRSIVHDSGWWHNVFHCLVVRANPEGSPTTILQRRSTNAKSFANKLDLSVTGHLQAGEGPQDGVREISEELGIEVEAEDLVPLGVRLLADDGGENINRERVHVFVLADTRSLTSFKPLAEEVQSLVEIQVADLQAILLGDGPAEASEWRPGTNPQKVLLEADQLVDQLDGYWLTLTIMADRFARGITPLSI